MKREEKILDVFVDESGTFGFGKDSSVFNEISFVFHDRKDSIERELNILNSKLHNIGFFGMIHIMDLIKKKNNHAKFTIKENKFIFNSLYYFLKKSPILIYSIILKKSTNETKDRFYKKLRHKLNIFVMENYEYFSSFSQINMFYDNGQEPIGQILDDSFNIFKTYRHIVKFDKINERLFQLADLITFLDKYYYKYKNKIIFSSYEKYFLSNYESRKIFNTLDKKRLRH